MLQSKKFLDSHIRDFSHLFCALIYTNGRRQDAIITVCTNQEAGQGCRLMSITVGVLMLISRKVGHHKVF